MTSHRIEVVVQLPAHAAVGASGKSGKSGTSGSSGGTLSYTSAIPHSAGTLVRVPLGRREVLGLVWEHDSSANPVDSDALKPIAAAFGGLPPLGDAWRDLVAFSAGYYQRSLGEVALAALPPQLRDLNGAQLARRLARRTADAPGVSPAAAQNKGPNATDSIALSAEQAGALARINTEAGPFLLFGATGSGKTEVYLRAVADALAQNLTQNPAAQALVMVPEINLTPQLEARFRARFEAQFGAGSVVSLHSGMTNPQRLASWLAAHLGRARIVLGTRMAVFASMPGLALIVVDEEHDASYKQQEGARYSARDLAVWRGRREGAKVILGSATPSLESWHRAQPAKPDQPDKLDKRDAARARYFRIDMPSRIGEGAPDAASRIGEGAPDAASRIGEGAPDAASRIGEGAPDAASRIGESAPDAASRIGESAPDATSRIGESAPDAASRIGESAPDAASRIGEGAPDATSRIGESAPVQASSVGAALPQVRTVDMTQQPSKTVISAPLLAAIGERIARGEQSMLFLNRRGYAPVLACADCDWKSECPHCSAYRVFHKIDRTLRCHHCGLAERVPRACPQCGNVDIAPVGRGTERLEEQLAELMAPIARPDGSPIRIARIDADSTRGRGVLEQQLAQVHRGEVDVLVGTQMIAKGHDFRRITLVAAINPDAALFSSDFRAPERLFSLLMQSAGRAGRDAAWLAAQGSTAEMWLQTFHPRHPMFAALRRHDFPAFAEKQLAERRAAGMPPFASQALLRADARTQAVAQSFLAAASAAGDTIEGADRVTRYPAVPLPIQRVADVERAQMLVESPSRTALQRFLAAWQPTLHEIRRGPDGKGVLRWGIDVDPQAI